MKTLEAHGLSDNTVIVYSADNGYYMGDRGFAGKWSHYEQSIREPMIIFDPRQCESESKPGLRSGRVERRLVLNADLPSTFLALAALHIPERYEGRSLLPLVRNERVNDWREDFLGEHLLEAGTRIPKWEGVRGERYMYARYFECEYEFLHDLEADTDQLTNFVDDPQYKEVLERLRKRCDELRDQYGGPYISRSRLPSGASARRNSQGRKVPSGRRDLRIPKEGAASIESVDGNAARFDGRSFLAAGKVPALDRDAVFTWSFWVRILPRHPQNGVLIGNRDSAGRGIDTFVKFTSHSFQYYHGRPQALRLNYNLPTEQWVHLAAVKEKANLIVYVDGRTAANVQLDFDMPELPFYVGGDPRANELSVCDVDEVRLYSDALTSEDILALSKRQSIDAKPLQHLSFDTEQRSLP